MERPTGQLQEQLLPVHLPSPARKSPLQHVQQHGLLIATAGFLSVLSLINAASFGLLLVPASAGLPATAGVPIFLIATVLAQCSLCFASGVPFAAGGATIEIVPLITPIAGLVASPELQTAEKASTLLAMLSCTSFIVGAFYMCVSRLRLGGLFRSIPLIVLKSALTGVGVFLVLEAIKMGVGLQEDDADSGGDAPPAPGVVAQLMGEGLPRLCATVALYLGLALVQWRTDSPFATLGYLALAVTVVAALRSSGVLVLGHAWYFGAGSDAASEGGPSPAGPYAMLGLLPMFSWSSVRLDLVVASIPLALAAAFVHALVTVTDLVALEGTATAAAERAAKTGGGAAPAAFSLDREMGAIGIGNLLSALVGGMPNYMQLTPSVVALRFTRDSGGQPGLYTAVISAALLPLLDDVVAAVPRPVIAAFLLDMGVGFLLETGVETMRHTVHRVDKALLVLVPTLMVALGFLQGLAVGLLLALLDFVLLYSSLPIVRWQQTGGQLRSNTVRPMHSLALLDVKGHHNVSIVSLQGYLMFGSAPQLTAGLDAMLKRRDECIARHAHDPSLHAPPWFILLDLRECRGCDFGGALEILKLAAVVRGRGGELRVAQPPPHVAAALVAASDGKLGPFKGFDEELRRAEDAVLAAHGSGQLPSLELFECSPPVAAAVRAGFHKTAPGDHEAVVSALTQHTRMGEKHLAAAATLLELGTIRSLQAEQVVWNATDVASFFVMVLSGQLSLRRHGHAIETAVPGAMQGFLFMLEREAGGTLRDTQLVSVAPSRVLILTAEQTATVHEQYPELAGLLTRAFLCRAAAEYRHWIRHAAVSCIAGGADEERAARGLDWETNSCAPSPVQLERPPLGPAT